MDSELFGLLLALPAEVRQREIKVMRETFMRVEAFCEDDVSRKQLVFRFVLAKAPPPPELALWVQN